MPIKVAKVADIIDGDIVLSGPRSRRRESDLYVKLSICAHEVIDGAVVPIKVNDPDATSAWKWDRDGWMINYPPFLSRSHARDLPIFLRDDKPTSLIYFRDRLFMSERDVLRDSDRAEVMMRVKKAVYDEESELSSLRAAVANMEAAIAFQRSGPKRDPIPEDVKLLVWARDGGCCVRCGSKQDLHFDHIIPVAKGGGSSDANIQILCQPCNLKKSDKIAFS